eukprot:TRINITY_DN80_c0_g2_i3.p1 TRINITY_DN80_c0_g2~~TRINITY_DN80_c0_g2_i3.p1  ORF type:complete len:546 (+),score=129.18 TRINITY_DN80_c0_g2_i3:566-2203(+)
MITSNEPHGEKMDDDDDDDDDDDGGGDDDDDDDDGGGDDDDDDDDEDYVDREASHEDDFVDESPRGRDMHSYEGSSQPRENDRSPYRSPQSIQRQKQGKEPEHAPLETLHRESSLRDEERLLEISTDSKSPLDPPKSFRVRNDRPDDFDSRTINLGPKKDSSTDPMTPVGRKEISINTDEIFEGYSFGNGSNAVPLMPLSWGAFDDGPAFLQEFRPLKRHGEHHDPKGKHSVDPIEHDLQNAPAYTQKSRMLIHNAGAIPLKALINKFNVIPSTVPQPLSAPAGSFYRESEWTSPKQSRFPPIRTRLDPTPNKRGLVQDIRDGHQDAQEERSDEDYQDGADDERELDDNEDDEQNQSPRKDDGKPTWLTMRSPKHYFVGKPTPGDKLPVITSRSNKSSGSNDPRPMSIKSAGSVQRKGKYSTESERGSEEEGEKQGFSRSAKSQQKGKTKHPENRQGKLELKGSLGSLPDRLPPISQGGHSRMGASSSAPSSSHTLGRIAPYKPYTLKEYKNKFKPMTEEEKRKHDRKLLVERQKAYVLQQKSSK